MYEQKISKIQDTIRVMATMVAFNNEDKSDIIWTSKIVSSLSRIEMQNANAAINKLQMAGYIARHEGSYIITDDGREWYSGVCSRPAISRSIAAWKEEVLSGMDKDGKPTQIDSAVIPGTQTREESFQSIEDLLSRAKQKTAIAFRLGIDMSEFNQRVRNGSLRLCRGHNGVRHVGIFHRKHYRNGWQHLCRECRKVLRKKKKK